MRAGMQGNQQDFSEPDEIAIRSQVGRLQRSTRRRSDNPYWTCTPFVRQVLKCWAARSKSAGLERLVGKSTQIIPHALDTSAVRSR